MTTIPAVCENGHYYLDSEHVGINPGQRITIEDVRTGPCPACGASARFENGTYWNSGTLRERIAIALRAIAAIVRPK